MNQLSPIEGMYEFMHPQLQLLVTFNFHEVMYRLRVDMQLLRVGSI
jgi:hypothetical protein